MKIARRKLFQNTVIGPEQREEKCSKTTKHTERREDDETKSTKMRKTIHLNFSDERDRKRIDVNEHEMLMTGAPETGCHQRNGTVGGEITRRLVQKFWIKTNERKLFK